MSNWKVGISTLLMFAMSPAGASPGAVRFPGPAYAAEEKRDDASEFFKNYAGLNNDQIKAIRSGQAVAKILDAPTADQVFVFGAVYVKSTPEEYLKMASDIDALKKLPNYLAIRKFSDPPQLSDLDGLSLEEDDFKDLQKCREGKCEMQLPTDAMEEFRTEVNWSAADAHDQANSIAKRLTLEALKKYEEGGNAELGVYRDKNNPAAVEQARFRRLSTGQRRFRCIYPNCRTIY